jgi:hypothetical protein
MKLTVEIETGEHPEVAVCFDAEGLEVLLRKLEYLKSNGGHLHLMTPAWAGDDLSEEVVGGSGYRLIHSLRLVCLPEAGGATTS